MLAGLQAQHLRVSGCKVRGLNTPNSKHRAYALGVSGASALNSKTRGLGIET